MASLGGIWELADVLSRKARRTEGRIPATYLYTDDDGTAWVLLAGADEPTPVTGMVTADLRRGDVVEAVVGGGLVSVSGNASAPSVGERVVSAAIAPVRAAVSRATESIVMVRSIADAAKAVADAIDQHFWTDTNGIHVTEVTQDAWKSEPSGANVLINSIGQLFRRGTMNLLALLPAQTVTDTFTGDGSTRDFTLSSKPLTIAPHSTANPEVDVRVDGVVVDFVLINRLVRTRARPASGAVVTATYKASRSDVAVFDGRGNETGNILARFGESGTQTGAEDQSHVTTDDLSATFYDANGDQTITIASGYTDDEYGYATTRVVYPNSPTDTITDQLALYISSIKTSGSTLDGWSVDDDGVTVRLGTTVSSSLTISYRGASTHSRVFYPAPQITIGKPQNASHAYLDYHSMQLVDKEDTTYFWVSDLRNADGIATLVEYFLGNGSRINFMLQNRCKTVVSVKLDGVSTSDYTKTGDQTIVMSTAPADGVVMEVTYTTESANAKAFTFGTRTGGVGAMSFAAGHDATASGTNSHAVGNGTAASGADSHAEGHHTTASKWASHAEGYYTTASGDDGSHAEGAETVAGGLGSHAEGYYSNAGGTYSHAEGMVTDAGGSAAHAQNMWTIASGDNQTALGRYNVPDTTSAVIIGNGTDDDARSNALAVDWDGNVRSAGNLLYLDAGNYGTAHTYLEAVDYNTGATGTRVGSTRNVTGTDVYNNINLNILADGTRQVRFSSVVPWQEALDTHYLPGDTISGSCRAGGYVTNSGRDIRWTIPLSKPISGSVSCTSMSMTVRMAGTYIYGTSSGNANVPVGALTCAVTPSGIDCQYRASAAISGATNNSECSVQVTYSFKVS